MSAGPWQLQVLEDSEVASDYLKKDNVPKSHMSGPAGHGISAKSCFFSFDIQQLSLPSCFSSIICVLTIIQFVFGLRVWALWGRSRKVAICLAVTLALIFAAGLYKVILIRETQGAFETYYYRISGGQCPPQLSGENGVSNGSTITLGFIMIAVYELVVLILTLIKASGQGWLGSHGSGSRFINGFLSQGVAYNCLILAVSMANVIVRYKLSSAYVNLLILLQPVLHSVLTSRMMLYLRKNTFQHQAFSTNDSLTGIVDPHRLESVICCPSASCPQISVSFLDSGVPLTLENQPVWASQ
ncbi:hypothetical protein L218DRAFT_247531 [Marasmius fiardii PR-910]|nr:hypothetical protein L218DRAFT_247531 [Marasmius fiardii PR-910]